MENHNSNSYKVFEEQDVFYTFLIISTFQKLIQLTDFLGGIQNCITVIGEFIFDSNIHFTPPLTSDNMDYC